MAAPCGGRVSAVAAMCPGVHPGVRSPVEIGSEPAPQAAAGSSAESPSDPTVPSPSGSSSGGSSPPRSVPAISSSARLSVGDEARLHPEVDGLRMVGDDRHGGLLGLERVAVGERHADLREAEQALRPSRARTGRDRRGSPTSSGGPGRGRSPSSARTRACSHSARPSAACTPSPWTKSCSANSPSRSSRPISSVTSGPTVTRLQGDPTDVAARSTRRRSSGAQVGRKKSARQIRSCLGWRGKTSRSISRSWSSGSKMTSSLPSALHGK